MKAFVVSTGVISAIGNDTESCLESLKESTSGIKKSEFLDTFWKDELPVGEVSLSSEALARMSGLSSSLPRTALLSAVAASESFLPFKEKLKGLKVGFFSANTVGGMDVSERNYPFEEGDGDKMEKYCTHECGTITEIVAGHLGIDGFVTTISTACSSSANSVMMASQMIEQGFLDAAVAGGADCLTKFTLNGFKTLMILDKEPCQPFDQNRRGLNLGEGAGYLLLMNEKALEACGAKAICYVSGYANANDAYHQTASSPEGTGNKLAMRHALEKSGLDPEQIDYINLHGTGTANNDSSEGIAISEIFGNRIPRASSTKSYTGHTLGGCGGVEAVFSVLAIREGLAFPNLRWETRMEELDWEPVTKLEQGLDIKHVLSNSFGFGGNCSSLILSKTEA